VVYREDGDKTAYILMRLDTFINKYL